jgi:hypothetical protein
MPTVWRERGFDFMIHSDDHEPAHVHAYKAGGVVQLYIADSSMKKVVDMKLSDVRLAKSIVTANCAFFMSEWRKIHDSD